MDTRHGIKLREIQLWFPAGVAGKLYVRVLKGGAPLIPDNRFVELDPQAAYGDGITCEGGRLVFKNLNSEFKGAEYISIEYRNKDTTDTFELFADFDFRYLTTKESGLRT